MNIFPGGLVFLVSLICFSAEVNVSKNGSTDDEKLRRQQEKERRKEESRMRNEERKRKREERRKLQSEEGDDCMNTMDPFIFCYL